jgi:GAF domain-containing protein
MESGRQRDSIYHALEERTRFQNDEVAYAPEIASTLGVPIHISDGAAGINEAITFVKAIIRRNQNGG